MKISYPSPVRWFLPFIVIAAIAVPAAGQTTANSPEAALRSALKTYKSGDAKQGVAALLAVSPAKLEGAVRDFARAEIRSRQFADVEVTAIALTESAAASFERPGTQWRGLKALGEEIGALLIAAGDASSATHSWCLAADALSEALRDFVSLTPLLTAARAVFKGDAEILFASGSMYETRAYAQAGDVGRKGTDLSLLPPQTKSSSSGFAPGVGPWVEDLDRPANLKLARDYYNQVLMIAPQHAEARVRLARVLHQLGDLSGAMAALDTLPPMGLSQELTYLSRLFRAGIEEDLGHGDQAKAAYLSALEWRAQAPFVGLATLLRSGGDTAGSLAVTERFFRDAPDDDPWWSYLRGQGAHINERIAQARAAVR
jgi:tetratricopeptide (TPR) repeat protein